MATTSRALVAGPLRRARADRRVAGVCAGTARWLGIGPGAVRFAVASLVLCGGVGLALYVVLALFVPVEDEGERPAAAPADPVESVAAVLVALGAVLLLRARGAWVGDGLGVPGLLASAGVALLWGRPARTGRDEGRTPLRLALGATLLLLGALASAAVARHLGSVGAAGLGAVALLVAGGLVLAPWAARLTGDLASERRERIRSQERAELAAHLHDSVLQTLALIQRRAGDGREVAGLARQQERELRSWLYGERVEGEATTVAAHLQRCLAEVEDQHRVRVEVVTVGDAPLDDAGRALVLAAREAVVNAAAHAAVEDIDVFLEVEPEATSAFVRDRGAGFEPALVPGDRRGIAESIQGRMARVGGEAHVRSRLGEGTEVELRVPRGRS